jgi:glycosyltransferase involved in cell wall biosynthesis
MRVLHVISGMDPRFGGPGFALAGLAAAQQSAGMAVTVAASYYSEIPNMPSLKALKDAGGRVELIGPAHGFLHRHAGIVPTLQRTIAASDVVHIHALWDELQHQAAAIARRHGVPSIFRPCGMLDPWSLAQGRLKKLIYLAWRLRYDLNAAAAIHYTSGAERDLAARLKLRAISIVEPNGLNLDEFETLPTPGRFREQYPSLRGRKMLLFMGRLHPKKGLDLLIPALDSLSDRTCMLVIAGPEENGYRAQVQKWVSDRALGERVIFRDMLSGEEKVSALADADLFVLPSYQENFGNAVIEALAAGTPVVISDQVNIQDAISRAGLGGVARTEVPSLARMIETWLADDSKRAAAAAAARRFVWENFDWNRIARRWDGHYAGLAGQHVLRNPDSLPTGA